MEKLTIEQKAKAYDEALEKAKSWHTDAQIDFKKSLETLFPELAESEDERIRKLCEALVRTCFTSELCTKEEKDECIAWLEKQGQKSAWSEEDEERLKSCLNILQAKGIMGVTETVNTKWLKSLKDKCTWKPSKEQLKFLQHYADQNNYDGTVLTSLLNDLKKL